MKKNSVPKIAVNLKIQNVQKKNKEQNDQERDKQKRSIYDKHFW